MEWWVGGVWTLLHRTLMTKGPTNWARPKDYVRGWGGGGVVLKRRRRKEDCVPHCFSPASQPVHQSLEDNVV